MQVYNNPQIPEQTTPNFKAIKTVKCEGLYKQFPKYGNELIDTFKKNPKAMEFCKKYDVNLVFYACKEAMNSVASSILIFFENPTKNKFLGIFGSKQDKIDITGWGNENDTEKSLEASTNQLVDYMLESTEGKPVSGLLNQHLKLRDNEIQKILLERKNEINKKKLLNEDKNIAKTRHQSEKEKLDCSIKELIESSK